MVTFSLLNSKRFIDLPAKFVDNIGYVKSQILSAFFHLVIFRCYLVKLFFFFVKNLQIFLLLFNKLPNYCTSKAQFFYTKILGKYYQRGKNTAPPSTISVILETGLSKVNNSIHTVCAGK